MRFDIRHTARYRYSAPVTLGAHVLRLRPRCDGSQELLSFECDVTPAPSLRCEALDEEGNVVNNLWFTGETPQLEVTARMAVQTLRENPFDYVPSLDFSALPMRYPSAQAAALSRYRQARESSAEVVELADRLAANAENNPIAFLDALNLYLHENIAHEARPGGGIKATQMTLHEGKGASRDVAALFMAVCREQDFAARYVIGYQADPPFDDEAQSVHAWPEVFVPGGGWRGYDPSRGLAVAAAHVALAANIDPLNVVPVEGTYFGSAFESDIEVEIDIQAN